jgi:uncharacterized membrane protein
MLRYRIRRLQRLEARMETSLNGVGRTAMRFILAAFYAAAGALHLTAPDQFLAITPDFVPFAKQVILITGLCEIAGAAALLTKRLRWAAGVAFALYALLVWPANFKHALDGIAIPGMPSSWWYHGPRLALQPVIIWWALYCAGVIDWPWRKRAASSA